MVIVLVPLATGFEEVEAISIIDILRRGDINVIIASVEGQEYVSGANNITVKTDCLIDGINTQDIDMIVLPGGWGGAKILAENSYVQKLLKEMDSQNKNIGAICAAPFALDKAKVLKDKFTCYPSVEKEIKASGYISNKQVVRDTNILTSRGPGTAICFGLEIVKILMGEEKKKEVESDILADFCD